MNRDRQLIGFTFCLGLLSFLAVLGLESRLLLEFQSLVIGWMLPLVLFVLFFTIPLVISRYLMERLIRYPSIVRAGKAQQVEFRKASKRVEQYIIERAKKLNAGSRVRVRVLPFTFNTVDAYVLGGGRDHIIVLSRGAEALFLASSKEGVERFKFLIDHEIGHIKAQDTAVLYYARGIIYSLLFWLPVKPLLWSLVSADIVKDELTANTLINYISQFFPRSVNRYFSEGELSAFNITNTAGKDLTIALIVLFALVSSLMVSLFYREIVRRREFLADQFASKYSPHKPGKVSKVMMGLLSHGTLKKLPSQSFKTNTRWHPSFKQRVNNIVAEGKEGLPSIISVACILGVCALFRFCFGAKVGESYTTYLSYFQVILSGVFALFIGFMFDSLLNGDSSGTQKGKRWVTLSHVLGWSLSISFGFIVLTNEINGSVLDSLSSDFDYQEYSFTQNGQRLIEPISLPDENGMDSLLEVELNERRSLIWSMPLTFLVFGVVFLFLPMVWKKYTRNLKTYFIGLTCATVVAICILGAISWAWEPQNQQRHRELLDKYETQHKTWGRELQGVDYKAFIEDRIKETRKFYSDHHYFYPPLAFLLLKEMPFDGASF